MSFSPCIIVPCYNHGTTLIDMVARLSVHALPIFIVDDGSDSATAKILQDLAEREPCVRLFQLPENRGKGAAVMHGMREAHAGGFSHALQIDADNQHDCADVARFLAAGQASPTAVICGQPVYDESVPRSRLYGRYFTHIWVWIETLSFAIGDSMCGYRLYPLAAVIALIDRVNIAERMSFDIEILVRLSWQGVPIRNLRTRVTYPANGLSHFDLLRDNLRISATHTKLVFGMLWRLPWLLFRRFVPKPAGTAAGAADTTHWSGMAERGSAWGIGVAAAAYRLLGRRMTLFILLPVVSYFFVTGRQARAASRVYLQRLAEHNAGNRTLPAPTLINQFRHFLAFTEASLDKLAAWHGDIERQQLDFPNESAYEDIARSGRGALFIGAHLGNLEITRALAVAGGIARVNAVVYTRHARRFASLLAGASHEFGVNLLEVEDFSVDTAIALRDKIAHGELLVIVGDRTPPADNGRVVHADFLGHSAPFAQGPFVLAHLLECPVYLFFCLKQGGRYHVHLEHFAERVILPRRGRESALADHVQRYASRLEHHCRLAPLQWFNFFDFWQTAGQLDKTFDKQTNTESGPA